MTERIENVVELKNNVLMAMDENGKYHAFDINGNEIIPGVFDYLSPVSAGKMLGYREGEGWMLLSICG